MQKHINKHGPQDVEVLILFCFWEENSTIDVRGGSDLWPKSYFML